MRSLVLSAVLALALAVLPAAGPSALAADEEILIGIMAPLTDDWASEGQDMVKVVEILADQINAAGGVGGAKVVLVTADDQGKPNIAVQAAQKLVTAGVVAVVGTYGSSVTGSSQDTYDEAGVVQVATGSTAIYLSEKGLTRFFRTCPRDDEQGRVLAANVKALGFKRVAIVHDNSSYAKGLADEARAIMKADGIEEVFYDAITAGDQDYSATLTKIRATNPDVIVFTGYYPEAALILRQKRAINWDVPMIGGDATNNTELIVVAGAEAAAGYRFVSPPSLADMTTESAVKFSQIFQSKHNTQPSSVWAILAGDAFSVIVEAVRNVGADPDKIAEYLHTGLKDFPGLSGPISFNEKGDRIGDVYRLYEVDADGRFVLR